MGRPSVRGSLSNTVPDILLGAASEKGRPTNSRGLADRLLGQFEAICEHTNDILRRCPIPDKGVDGKHMGIDGYLQDDYTTQKRRR